jgi:diazepam-binding inhibitor (GABA receptor modulating acyl-CoA-binding protein)
MVAQSAEFKKAIEDSRSLSQTPTNDELLEVRNIQEVRATSPSTQLTVSFSTQIYGLFKQGSGESHDAATKPGMFDMKVRLLPPD